MEEYQVEEDDELRNRENQENIFLCVWRKANEDANSRSENGEGVLEIGVVTGPKQLVVAGRNWWLSRLWIACLAFIFYWI